MMPRWPEDWPDDRDAEWEYWETIPPEEGSE